MKRFVIACLLLICLLPTSVSLAKDGGHSEDSGAQNGLTVEIKGESNLNKLKSSYSYTHELLEKLSLKMTLENETNSRPLDQRFDESSRLRFDLDYSFGERDNILIYYEHKNYFANHKIAQQTSEHHYHYAGSQLRLYPSERLNLTLLTTFASGSLSQSTYDWYFDTLSQRYDELSADTTLTLAYDLSDYTRLNLSINGSRDLRDHVNNPTYDSEYYIGAVNPSLSGTYTLFNMLELKLTYNFSGSLYRDMYQSETDKNLQTNSITLGTKFSPFKRFELTLNSTYNNSQTNNLRKDVWLNKYFYRIYPELNPIPGDRTAQPYSPLYDIFGNTVTWKLGLNWDWDKDNYFHWSIDGSDGSRRYYDDDHELPETRFSTADSVSDTKSFEMISLLELMVARQLSLNVRHSIGIDTYEYPLNAEKYNQLLKNTIRAGADWKINSRFSVGSQVDLAYSYSTLVSKNLPYGINYKISIGADYKIIDGVKLNFDFIVNRYNQRTINIETGQDRLSREIKLQPIFSFSELWSLSLNGVFKESITFPVGEYSATSYLSHIYSVTTQVNIQPTDTFSFDISYKHSFHDTFYAGSETKRIEHKLGLDFSYSLFENLVMGVGANYNFWEFSDTEESFNVGLTLRSTM
ncbi:hypothetical protein K8R78_01670 [bacterium]|nr:hypothetical protein [bacterium]